MDVQSQTVYFYSDSQEKEANSETSKCVKLEENSNYGNNQTLLSSSKDFCFGCTYWKNHSNPPAHHK